MRFFVLAIVYLTYFVSDWEGKSPGMRLADVIMSVMLLVDILTFIALEIFQII